MALYSGPVGGYTAPDGRSVQLPADFAAQFPSLRPIAPPPPLPPPPGQQIGPMPGAPPADPGAPSAAPEPMTALPLPAGAAPVWTPDDSAELAKQTVQSSSRAATPLPTQPGAPAAPRRAAKKEAPAQEGDGTAPAPSPGTGPAARRPLTDADLQKMGVAGPAGAALAAADEKRAAIQAQSDALVNQATQVGDAMAAAAADAQKRLEANEQEATRRQVALDQHTQWFQEQTKKIANTKIDRSADHPILAAIGIALGALGTAMQNRDAALAAAFRGQPAPAPVENPALKAFYAAIDRKVAAQMQDLDNQRTALQMSGQGIGMERQANMDRETQMGIYRNGYLEVAKQKIEAIKQKTQLNVVKSNADVMLADVSREQADTLGAAQTRFQTHQDAVAARNQQAALAKAQLNQAAKFHADTMGFQWAHARMQQEDKMAEVAARLLKEGKDTAAAKLKMVQEGALFDPRTRDPLLTPAGRQKYADADKLESDARRAKDPEIAAKQRAQAQAIRDGAMLFDTITVDPKVATKLRDQIGVAQEVTDQIDDVATKLEQDPSAFNRAQWAGIATQMGNLANVYQKTIGERISVRAFEQAMKHILEFDPDSIFDRVASQKRALESMKQLKNVVAGDINNALGKEGVKTDWSPVRSNEQRLNFDEKTAAELGQERQLGYANIARYTSLNDRAQEEEHDAAAMERGAESGLRPQAVARVRALAQRASGAGDAEYGRIVDAIAAPIQSGLKEGGRSSLAIGMLDVLRNSNPAVYTDVVKSLPADDQKAIRARDATIRPAVNVPRIPGRFDPDAAAEEDAKARQAAASAAFARPPQNSPGAGTPR